MGPIERELRGWTAPVMNGEAFCFALSSDAWGCCLQAWLSLKLGGHPQTDEMFPDIMSEAIEAASELGL
jgi:hypothetical protein